MQLPIALLAFSGLCTAAYTTPRYPITAASGWTVRGVATGLTSARGIKFDSAGHLLVVEQNLGIVGLTLATDGSLSSTKSIINNTALNHGIEISPDGTLLYASSSDAVYRWNYSASTMAVSNQVTIVSGMNNTDHSTRTLLLSKANPNTLIVSRGSSGNVDDTAINSATGHATIAVFDLTAVPSGGYTYSQGKLVAYGVRNEVGIGEDGAGNLWGVENSADDLTRTVNGVSTDVHQDNPGEKLHRFGNAVTLANSNGNKWYGYPTCFSVWSPSLFPAGTNLNIGDFFVQAPNSTFNDASCAAQAIKPRLLFQAHSAPLDIKWGPGTDTNAYVTFHGSWDRQPPTGYKVVLIPGTVSAGAWDAVAPLSSNTGYTDLLWNNDITSCGSGACMRPVGLAWHPTTSLLYVSSDASGEILVLFPPGSITSTVTSPSGSSTSVTTTTTSSPVTTSKPAGCTSPKWGQCAGMGWTGCTACAAGSTCTYSNPYYSQCL